jgi:hypothetical protein
MARGFALLSLALLGCGHPAKPPVTAPPPPAVVHARLGATKETGAESSAELFALWSKTAEREKGEAKVRTSASSTLDLTVTASTKESALFACREILSSIASEEERAKEGALARIRERRAQVTARLSEVARSLHGFEIATHDEAAARTDLERKLAAAKLAGEDFPGALGSIASAHHHATAERASLASMYGPKHPTFAANELEIALLEGARDAQRKIEVSAAESELQAFDALPKKKRTPEAIADMRRKLLIARLSAPGVTAASGVDVEAPPRLRELALAHLGVRIERTKQAVTLGDAHPRMLALSARLHDLELEFEKVLALEIARLQKNEPVDDRALRHELEELVGTLSALIGEEDAIVKQAPRLVVVSPCAG